MSTKAYNLGKYQLLECIARGGMGEVWKALDTQLKRNVAIKLLHPGIQQDPDFITRFEQEARLVASLHHPNIIKIHNFHVSYPPESDPPLCYMVMDYVQGQTLADYIHDTSHRGEFPPAADIVYIFTVVGLALDYAHQSGMIHRDIKPANILLDKRIPTARTMGEPILTDFGIARQRGTTTGTVVGSVIGTPKYIAPEQAQGRYDDPRSDLYSLGVILYEIMTGETPFHADTPLAIVMQHLREKPKPPELINPQVSPALSEMILKSIAKDPEARFSTAAALALALTQAFNISAPEHSGGSSEPTLPGSSSSALTFISVPPLHPSSGVQTPFIGLPVDQSPPFTGPQGDQSISGAKRPIDSVTPNDTLTGSNLHTLPAKYHQSVKPLYETPLQANVSGQVNAASGGPKPRGEAKPSQLKNKKLWVIGLTALLVLVLLGSGLIAQMLLFPPSTTPPDGETVIGHVSFIKNGASPNYNAVQIDIAHVPELSQGMAYYAWIELTNGQASENTIPPHWQLTVNNQAIHTGLQTFAGFDNLYVPPSLFLITKERTDNPPIVPDPVARLYYARVTFTTLDLKQCPASNTTAVCF